MLLERGGITYGIFGLMGTDSDDCAPTPGFTLEDPIEAAKRCVKALEEQGAQFIICLSHGGTNVKESKSEDQQLAKNCLLYTSSPSSRRPRRNWAPPPRATRTC